MRLIIPPRVGVDEIDLGSFGPKSILAVDTETTGLNPYAPPYPARPFLVSMCDEYGKAASVSWRVDPRTRLPMPEREHIEILRKYLCDEKIAKVMFNAKFDMRMLAVVGIDVKGFIWDSSLGQHIINPAEPNKKLKHLCDKYLDISDDDEKALKDSTRKARADAKARGWKPPKI